VRAAKGDAVDLEVNPKPIWGVNPAFLDCVRSAREAAPRHVPVLIEGETGTGKDLLAELIYLESPFRKERLQVLGCGTLYGEIGTYDVFGHEVGAFPGAVRRRAGALELSADGSLFLDEISVLEPELQRDILDVLRKGTFSRIGGKEELPWNGRLICTTNGDVEGMVSRGAFLRELFDRISAIRIRIPPLRKRLDDIPVIAGLLLSQLGPGLRFEDGIMGALTAYSWPGNVRELQYAIEYLHACAHGSELKFADLREEVKNSVLIGPVREDP
jgi:two-component system response regulator AtoC